MSKLTSLLVWIALFVGTTVYAQGPQGGNRAMRSASERAKMESENLKETLNLTAEQTSEIQKISLKFAQQDSISFASMREQGQNVDREKMMQDMRERTEKKGTEMKAVLTPEQQKAYDKWVAERGNRMGGNRQRQ